MRGNYDGALRRLLVHEGGYTNHPNDPGGPTNFGITIHDYRKYINPNGTASDVRAMNVEQAKTIYRAKYWDVQRCDDLPSGVDYSIFDYGVNSGVGRSGKVLRRLLGMPDNTHTITNAVVQRANRANATTLVKQINDERLAFLKRLKTWPTFGAGWSRRVAEVRKRSLQLAEDVAPVPPPPDVEPVPEPETPAQPWFKRLWTWIATGLFGTGITIGGVTLNAETILAICVLIGVMAAAFLAWVYLVPPRGKIKKGQ